MSRDHWLSCATCDGTGVAYAAGPDYFGNYDSRDCLTCSGYGAIAPACVRCGGPVPPGEEGRISGMCQTCLNGPVPDPTDLLCAYIDAAPGSDA